jgi:hypothetical protein
MTMPMCIMHQDASHVGNLLEKLKNKRKAKFLMLPLGGLHVKHAVQRGICVPTQ